MKTKSSRIELIIPIIIGIGCRWMEMGWKVFVSFHILVGGRIKFYETFTITLFARIMLVVALQSINMILIGRFYK